MGKRPTAVGVALACLVALLVGSARADAATVSAAFSQSSVWSTGYGGQYVLTNTGDAESTGWVVEFDLPPGSTVVNAWNSVLTRDGQHYRFANAAFNGRIPPGARRVSGSTCPVWACRPAARSTASRVTAAVRHPTRRRPPFLQARG